MRKYIPDRFVLYPSLKRQDYVRNVLHVVDSLRL